MRLRSVIFSIWKSRPSAVAATSAAAASWLHLGQPVPRVCSVFMGHSPASIGLAEPPPTACRYQPRDWLHIQQTESITGTSTSTPTTVASAAPEPGLGTPRRHRGQPGLQTPWQADHGETACPGRRHHERQCRPRLPHYRAGRVFSGAVGRHPQRHRHVLHQTSPGWPHRAPDAGAAVLSGGGRRGARCGDRGPGSGQRGAGK
jgi:hypothetical protein